MFIGGLKAAALTVGKDVECARSRYKKVPDRALFVFTGLALKHERKISMKIQLSDHFTCKRLLKFVLPSVVMMIFTSIYCVIDGLFVSLCPY